MKFHKDTSNWETLLANIFALNSSFLLQFCLFITCFQSLSSESPSFSFTKFVCLFNFPGVLRSDEVKGFFFFIKKISFLPHERKNFKLVETFGNWKVILQSVLSTSSLSLDSHWISLMCVDWICVMGEFELLFGRKTSDHKTLLS